MQFKTLALATTSLMALGLAAAPVAQAKGGPQLMGEVELDLSYYWDDWNFGSEGSSSDSETEYTTFIGAGRVNIPYDEWYNLQVDIFGLAALADLDTYAPAGFFGGATHINWRNPNVGLLGVAFGVGRVNSDSVFGGKNAMTFLAALEGQWYCERWTFYGQLGYWDSDQNSFLLQNAGFLRGVVTYYGDPRWKIAGALKYIDGEITDSGYFDEFVDSDSWDWSLRGDYMFGRSMPVATFLEIGGRYADTNFGSSSDPELDVFWVNLGVTFYLGGDGVSDLQYHDRNGASVDMPNFDEVRAPLFSYGIF